MIFPALNEILAVPDPSAISICFFSKCQISFCHQAQKRILIQPQTPLTYRYKAFSQPMGPTKCLFILLAPHNALCQAFPCSAPFPFHTVARAEVTCPWDTCDPGRPLEPHGESSAAPASLCQECSRHSS